MTVDPGQVLTDARNAFRRGSHADALEKYLWFYHNSLERSLAFYGVRLSYVVFELLALGKVYPPAREALESIQSSNLQSLRDGSHHPSEFHDFASINERLGRHQLTSELFASLAESDPEFARRCFPFARVAVISTGNFTLARRFVTSPTEELDASLVRVAKMINADSTHDETLIGIYAKHIRQLSSIFEGVGENEKATFLQMKATEALTDPCVREELRRQLLWR